MCALSPEVSSEPALEAGLAIDEIEARLSAAAKRHHLEERNIAYWLLEIDERGLHKKPGFSSIGDYALELVGIKPRKAQYLVFIASRLEKLPQIRAAFDSGELPWTKAREITGVATPETEAEWLEKARALSNRDLEREARRNAGQTSGAFATVIISMPVEILAMWNDAYELAERVSGTELEKWQVLEPSLAEFLGTHLPTAAPVEGAEGVEVDDEKELPYAVRQAVFNRDRWQCKFPGCTMRKMLDVHHIVFRSRGGSDDIGNLICLCRIHHGRVHRGICSVTGTVGVDVKFERPHLFTEQKPVAVEEEPVAEDAVKEVSPPDDDDDDESWRDEIVADIFDGPPSPKPPVPYKDYGEFIAHWIDQKQARDREDRARKRRASGAHVCAESETGEPNETSTPEVVGGPSGGDLL